MPRGIPSSHITMYSIAHSFFGPSSRPSFTLSPALDSGGSIAVRVPRPRQRVAFAGLQSAVAAEQAARMSAMQQREMGMTVRVLPSGTGTLLFADIQDSTQPWDRHPGR